MSKKSICESQEAWLDLRQNSRVMGRGVVVMKQPRLYKRSSFFQFQYEYPSIEDVGLILPKRQPCLSYTDNNIFVAL